MAPKGTVKFFRDWADKAKPGETVTYFNTAMDRRPRAVFEFFRDDARFMLTQRRENWTADCPADYRPVTYWCATRISQRAFNFIKRAPRAFA